MTEPSVKVPPQGYHIVNPYLTVRNVQALIEFVHATFGGVVTERIIQPGGDIEHAEIRIGDSLLMVGPPEVDSLVAASEHSRPSTFYVFVADVDRVYHRAMEHGANSFMAPTEMFYGDRVAAFVDSNDNVWWIACRETPIDRKKLQARADEHWHKKQTKRK